MGGIATLPGTLPGPLRSPANLKTRRSSGEITCYAGNNAKGVELNSDIGVEAQLAIQEWRDAQNRAEIDPDSDLTALMPAISRFVGWLCEPETVERRGLRVCALEECVRPDLNSGRSLGQTSAGTSKQNLSKLMTDCRSTFHLRPSAHQAAKGAKV
jgi:hypothetical protein